MIGSVKTTYDTPKRKPVKTLAFSGPLCTALIAETDKHGNFQVCLGSKLDDPCALFFNAEAARAAAEFFEHIAKIIDNGGYEPA